MSFPVDERAMAQSGDPVITRQASLTQRSPAGKSEIARKLLLLLAVGVGMGLAHMSTSTMPLQIGALMDGAHRTAAQAGYFGFAQVAALAFSMVMMAGWVDRVPPWQTAISGCVLIVVANLGLFSVGGFAAQLAFGAAAGCGYGAVFSAAIAAAAATAEPDRVYAIGNGGALMVVVSVMSSIPAVDHAKGPRGIFLAIAAAALVSGILLRSLTRGAHVQEVRLSAWRTPGAPGLLLAWGAWSSGAGGLYAFSERIGVRLARSPDEVAWVLSAGVFIGIIGTAATAILGRRVSRPLVLIVGVAGSALSCLLVGYAWDLAAYATGVFAYWIFTMFTYSYLLGTAALLDSSGRVGTLSGGCDRFGYATGTAIAGVLAEHFSYSSVGMFGFAACALGALAGFPTLFRALCRHQRSRVAA
jgi:predicted MFS family arabinose efflux permease